MKQLDAKYGSQNLDKLIELKREHQQLEKKLSQKLETNVQLEEYLNFCTQVLPQNTENMGGIFQERRDFQQKALDFLEQNNNDFMKTKFYISFPVIYAH